MRWIGRKKTAVRIAALGLLCGGLAGGCGPSKPSGQQDAEVGQDVAVQPDVAVQSDAANNDRDGDGVPDDVDACPDDPNQWSDADGDGYCDEVDDGCPGDPNRWTDTDGDGVCDEDDDCPNDPNGSVDTNGDGLCDGNDDIDGDGVTNGEEEVYGADCAISDPLRADTDGDGIDDPLDPYPRDPFPEYILYRNDLGTIDIMLSNRDGTFQSAVQIGEPFGCTPDAQHNCGNTDYRYVGFVISDFDNNGSMDFLAIGDADLADTTNDRELWYFWRSADISIGSSTVFEQRLVERYLDRGLFGVAADFDNDFRMDLATMESTATSPYGLTYFHAHLNTGLITTATCAYTTDPTNPNGCAFIRQLGVDISPHADGLWAVRYARDAVDVDGDGNRDLVFYTYASGGASSAPTYLVTGNGDGTFNNPASAMFTFFSGGCGSSPANTCLFGDFNNDSIGDLIMGLDDDGDAGSAWFIPGQINGTTFSLDTTACVESFDINPTHESGGEHPGYSGSAKSFDFDFDGNLDVILGFTPQSAWDPPTRTVLLMGNGTGLYGTPTTIREFATETFGNSFAVPKPLCTRFPTGTP